MSTLIQVLLNANLALALLFVGLYSIWYERSSVQAPRPCPHRNSTRIHLLLTNQHVSDYCFDCNKTIYQAKWVFRGE